MTEQGDAEAVPPYVSFATLMNQVERMTKEGVPGRIDGSFLVGMAGGTQNQFKLALRALGLINDNDQPTSELIQLVRQPNDRAQLIADLLRERFPRLVALDANATRGQLDEVLGTYGLGADTRRKAATFYVAAASFAGLPLSPYLRPTRGANSVGTQRRRPKTTRRVAADSTPTAATTASVTAPDEMRRAYFDLLIEKAKGSDSAEPDLFDRIERLIGTPPGTTGQPSEARLV